MRRILLLALVLFAVASSTAFAVTAPPYIQKPVGHETWDSTGIGPWMRTNAFERALEIRSSNDSMGVWLYNADSTKWVHVWFDGFKQKGGSPYKYYFRDDDTTWYIEMIDGTGSSDSLIAHFPNQRVVIYPHPAGGGGFSSVSVDTDENGSVDVVSTDSVGVLGGTGIDLAWNGTTKKITINATGAAGTWTEVLSGADSLHQWRIGASDADTALTIEKVDDSNIVRIYPGDGSAPKKLHVYGNDGTVTGDTASITAAFNIAVTPHQKVDTGAGYMYLPYKVNALSFDPATAGTNFVWAWEPSVDSFVLQAQIGGGGENTSAINVGTGHHIFYQESGDELQFKRVAAGTGITADSTTTANTVTFHSTLGTVVDLASAEITGTLAVGNGGTGVTSFTAGSILLGNGTSPISNTGVLGDGVLIIGDNSGAPTLAAVSGDGTLSNAGVLAINDDSHSHTTSTISGLDLANDVNAFTSAVLFGRLSDETGSATGTPLAVFNQNPTIDGVTGTGTWDLSAVTADFTGSGNVTFDNDELVYTEIAATTSTNWATRISDELGNAGVFILVSGSPNTNDVPQWNGSTWVPAAVAGGSGTWVEVNSGSDTTHDWRTQASDADSVLRIRKVAGANAVHITTPDLSNSKTLHLWGSNGTVTGDTATGNAFEVVLGNTKQFGIYNTGDSIDAKGNDIVNADSIDAVAYTDRSIRATDIVHAPHWRIPDDWAPSGHSSTADSIIMLRSVFRDTSSTATQWQYWQVIDSCYNANTGTTAKKDTFYAVYVLRPGEERIDSLRVQLDKKTAGAASDTSAIESITMYSCTGTCYGPEATDTTITTFSGQVITTSFQDIVLNNNDYTTPDSGEKYFIRIITHLFTNTRIGLNLEAFFSDN